MFLDWRFQRLSNTSSVPDQLPLYCFRCVDIISKSNKYLAFLFWIEWVRGKLARWHLWKLAPACHREFISCHRRVGKIRTGSLWGLGCDSAELWIARSVLSTGGYTGIKRDSASSGSDLSGSSGPANSISPLQDKEKEKYPHVFLFF